MKTKIKAKKTAYEYGIYLLKFCNRSEAEIIKRLQEKSYSRRDITQALFKLKKYKLLDEETAVQLIISSRIHKNLSNQAVRAELLHKGYPIDIIEKHINVSLEETFPETSRALNLAEHMLLKLPACSDEKKLYSLQRLLLRKGFTYEIVEEIKSKLKKRNGDTPLRGMSK
ncbi:MAG: RecX family transcriptional regulator [bacterium]